MCCKRPEYTGESQSCLKRIKDLILKEKLTSYLLIRFMKFLTLLSLALGWCLCADGAANKTKLIIGAIFDINTRPGDENSAAMIPAVKMALRDVNNCHDTLVNYELELDIKDVKVTGVGVLNVYDEKYVPT